jgi:hypothetical protein
MPFPLAPPPLPRSGLYAPLPPDVIPALASGPFSYRKYHVFSLPWLMRRTLLASVAIVAYAVLAGLALRMAGSAWPNVAAMTAYFTAGFIAMVTGGPAIATWVRHRDFGARAEVAGIIVAVVLGFVIAMLADLWSSLAIARSLGEKDLTSPAPSGNTLDDARMSLFVVGSIFFHWAISGGVASFSYFSERRRLRARALHLAKLDSDMKLAVLQAQIEPHFLFNTLASIRPLIRQDAARAESALDALSDHLRITIPQMRTAEPGVVSTLGQQIDLCASYLAVMQVRMGTRLRYEIDVSSSLRAAAFPPLMLLSLVENAIKHGLEPKPGPGTIIISAGMTDRNLHVKVSDDGMGLHEGVSSGLGLSNIREQLLVRYGGQAALTVAARQEGGTMAEIMIPANL